MALPYFTPDTSVGTCAGAASSAVLLPGTPSIDAIVLITNLGNNHIAVKLGASNAVTVTMSTGVIIQAGGQLALGIGANTWIALTTGSPGTSSTVNLTTGT